MALRDRLAAFDWRYSLRELALIIVGILVALWLNEWNAQRHHRIAELVLLREIHSSLASDLSGLQETADALRLSEQRTSALRDHLLAERPYDGELDILFGSAYGFRLSRLNTAPYQALKGRGLDLVSDDAVRLAIVRVFETRAAELSRADEVIINVSFDVLRPYYLERFQNIEFLERATPQNYAEVAVDPYFRNLLDYRLVVLRRAILPRYEQAIEDIIGLVDIIGRELVESE